MDYKDTGGVAGKKLRGIVNEIRQRWQVNNIVIYHRIGKLKVWMG